MRRASRSPAGRKYDVYPIQGTGFDLVGRDYRPPDAGGVEPVWHGYRTCGRYAEPRRGHGGKACCVRPFSRCGELYRRQPEADPEQEVVSRWVIEQLSELKATTATFVLATPTETDGSVFPARIMLADVCNWTYRSEEWGMPGRLWRMNLTNPRQTRQKMPAANAVLAASCVITCRAHRLLPLD